MWISYFRNFFNSLFFIFLKTCVHNKSDPIMAGSSIIQSIYMEQFEYVTLSDPYHYITIFGDK